VEKSISTLEMGAYGWLEEGVPLLAFDKDGRPTRVFCERGFHFTFLC
jgi:hypothetical protein